MHDEISELLLRRCEQSDTTNWWAIAHVLPQAQILNRLKDEEKGSLLAKWWNIMESVASLLKEVWNDSIIDRQTMIVRRGNDSSTWNNTTNTWNKAREAWMALCSEMNMEHLLDGLCPGKVMPLIAADVAAWHRSIGNGLNPDTFVWNQLPFPWEVISGERICTRDMVKDACHASGVHPTRSGWTKARPAAQAVRFEPTPELVHGVTVNHPGLAKILRKAGVFSGKKTKSLLIYGVCIG